MIRDAQIQLFLRNMLLDGLQQIGVDLDLQYQGKLKQNLSSTYAVQFLIPTRQWAINDTVQGGSGIYKITVFSDIDKGLYLTDLTDSVKSIFTRGVYCVNAQTNVSICIDDTFTSPSIYQMNPDKVQRSVSIQYRKFRNS